MKANIHTPALRDIRITDPLFGHYVSLVAEQIIPYKSETLNDPLHGAENSYCVANFRVAAGELSGEHRGVVFSDSDAYKWLEAVAYTIENGSGERFIPIADELIALIGRAQQPDGYLNTYFSIACSDKKWTNLAEGHELYCAGHLIEAAVTYYSATGKTELLSIAERFAALICGIFGEEEGKRKGYPGHQEIEHALVKLYRVTRKKEFLSLARYFISERGKSPNYLLNELASHMNERIFPEFSDYDAKYAQTHAEPVMQRTAEGHAVRAMYMYSAMADIASECGDDALREACRELWHSVTDKRMYITGGIGSSGHLERFTTDYDLPNDRMYCESCASVGLMMFGQRMAALCRDASYYEVVERALCNTVLAGISVKGDRYFYVNPLEVWPENCLPGTSLMHVKPVRQPWYACSCCPPNIARTLASLGQYIYAEDDKSVYINQFISSEFKTSIQGVDVKLKLESSLLRDGKVRIGVETSAVRAFTVRARVPSYVKNAAFTLDGKAISPVIENGYAVLAVSREGAQTFELSGSVAAEWVAANENVRADIGRVALTYGAFVYCLEQTDNGENLANVYASPNAETSFGKPVSDLPGELPTIAFDGRRLTRCAGAEGALYGSPDFRFDDAKLTAVPYCLWCNRESGEMLVWIKALI